MGGDTMKIIGYVALAAAVIYTGGAAAGYWGGGTAGTAGTLGTATGGVGGLGGATVVPGTGITGSALGSNIGAQSAFYGGAGSGAGFGGSLLGGTGGGAALGSIAPMTLAGTGFSAAPAMMGAAVPSTLAHGANITNASLGSTTMPTIPGLTNASTATTNPGFFGGIQNVADSAGTWMKNNPMSTTFLGMGAMNAMNAQQPQMYPQPDFSSLQGMQTYDQSLANLTPDQLEAEMMREGLTPGQRNSVQRAMQNARMNEDRIFEVRMAAEQGGERMAGVKAAAEEFRDYANISDADIADQASVIAAALRTGTDRTYDEAKIDAKQRLSQLGRLASLGGTDKFGEIARAQVETNMKIDQQAQAEALRRNSELLNMRNQGYQAILAGANAAEVQDRWNLGFNEANRRYQLADNNAQRDQNYTTQLLGIQGLNNYNTANYAQQQKAAAAQGAQGLEMMKMGMRGFGDLVPSGYGRTIYDQRWA